MNAPLADLMRPQTIDEVVGQSHILSKASSTESPSPVAQPT